ncbi:MAG: hypothetical protein HY691_03665 [Chloroflexi bacterium]|nr:hypothetical protein [Chloroflexota bacterium]
MREKRPAATSASMRSRVARALAGARSTDDGAGAVRAPPALVVPVVAVLEAPVAGAVSAAGFGAAVAAPAFCGVPRVDEGLFAPVRAWDCARPVSRVVPDAVSGGGVGRLPTGVTATKGFQRHPAGSGESVLGAPSVQPKLPTNARMA